MSDNRPPWPTYNDAKRAVEVLRARALLEAAIASGRAFHIELRPFSAGDLQSVRMEVPAEDKT